MPNRRKGAPGSFGAPLDQLLPRLSLGERHDRLKVDVHRKPEGAEAREQPADRCRIFLLNQRLYERAKK
jgi:hypothetical protein